MRSFVSSLLALLGISRPVPALPAPESAPRDPLDPFGDWPVASHLRVLNEYVGGPSTIRADSIANPTSKLGTALDKATAGRPDVLRRMLSTTEIDALVRANGYARRIVRIVPSLATRKGWAVQAAGSPQDPLEADWKRLHVWTKVAETWRLARQHGGSVLMPILDEEVPPEFADRPAAWLREPLDLSRVRAVKALQVFERDELSPDEWGGDERSDHYGRVLRWQITPTNPGALSGSPVVHASRLIYWDGEPVSHQVRLRNNGFGDSVLEPCFDQIRNKTAVEQGMAHLIQEARVNVLKMSGLKGKQASDQAEAFDRRARSIAKGKSIAGIILLPEDDDFQTQSQVVSGLAEVDERAAAALAAVSGFPQTILFGDSPGGLNSDGESSRHTLAQLVSAHQEEEARDPVEWLARLLFRAKEGPTKGVEPEGWALVFRPLDEPTRTESAALEKTHAETDAIRINSGVVSAEHVARSRFGPAGYQDELSPLDEAELQPAPGFGAIDDVRAALQADAADGYPVPASVRANAERVIRWREEHPDEIQGMTEVGWRRARQLATEKTVGLPTLRRMAGFERHRANSKVADEHAGAPWKDAGHVAWLGWGGDEGIAWARRIVDRENRSDAAEPPALVWFRLEPESEQRLQAARTAAMTLAGFEPGTGPLHLTLLYRGPTTAADLQVLTEEVAALVAEQGADWMPPALETEEITVFAPDSGGRSAVVLEVGGSWLWRLREQLDARLRERDAFREGGWWFRPHVTLGYVDGERVPYEDVERLEHDPAGRLTLSIRSLEVLSGGATVRAWTWARA